MCPVRRMRCEMLSFRSTQFLQAICIFLSPRAPPHPKAEITAKHFTACQKSVRGVYIRVKSFLVPSFCTLTRYSHYSIQAESVFL